MCLLVVLSHIHPDAPLVVGANRDELLARPSVPMEHRSDNPRVLAGRDQLASGTWLSVNEHGVIAGLTNRPMPTGRDASKRSRGELPLLMTVHDSAEAAVEAFSDEIDPDEFNPCWMLVGDCRSLYYLEVLEGHPLAIERLPPGLWVLENRPLHMASPKANVVRSALFSAPEWHAAELVKGIGAVLQSHKIPDGAGTEPRQPPHPVEVDAACVHTPLYGTRSSSIIVIPAAPNSLPQVAYSDGPPCTNEYRDATALWG